MDAVIVVPGDIIAIKLGDIVPADCRLLEGDPLLLDESAMTGESLPVTKYSGQEAFSGSVVKQGEIDALVIATGKYTLMGHSCHLTDTTRNPGHFQEVLRKIGNFCFFIILVGIVGESIVMFAQHTPYRTGVENLVILLIGGIPIAMPTVLSVTMAIGSHALSSNQVIIITFLSLSFFVHIFNSSVMGPRLKTPHPRLLASVALIKIRTHVWEVTSNDATYQLQGEVQVKDKSCTPWSMDKSP